MSRLSNSPLFRTRKRAIVTVSGIVLVIAVVGLVAFTPLKTSLLNLFSQQTEIADDPTVIPGNQNNQESQKLYADAQQTAQSQGATAGQQVLDEALGVTTDKVKRATIYSQKATLATSYEGGASIVDGLTYAYQAEAENPTYGTAIMIADMEYAQGNKQAALTYYKLYLERLTPAASELNPGDKDAYQKRVTQLEAELGN